MTALAVSEPLEAHVRHTVIRLLEGDIIEIPADALVFYAREDLKLGSGFGTAIQVRGGDTVKKELAVFGGVRMGEAVITTGGTLKARHIVHACGPKYQEADTERKLVDCIRSALAVAAANGLRRIVFPPLGAGFYGVPLELCARLMLGAFREFLQPDVPLKEVVICVKDRREYEAFAGKLMAFKEGGA